MIRANIWLAITTMCGPAPMTTLARSARPAWPSPCPGRPEKHSSAGGRLTSACSKHALNTRHGKLTIIVAYAPTNLDGNDKKADFYALLQDVAGSRSPHDITIVLSDTNAALSRDARTNWPDVVGTTFVDRTTNDNGDRLLSFCRSTDLCIADSWFPRKQIHNWTWYSNDGFTKKAIYHIIISRRWLRCATQCRVFRGAQLGNTDHRLLCANIRLKLKAPPGSHQHHQPDISRLADPSTKLQYQCEMPSLNQQTRGRTSKTPSQHAQQNVQDGSAPAPRSHGSPQRPLKSLRAGGLPDFTETSRNTAASTQYEMPPLRTTVQLSGRKRQPPWMRLLSVKIKAPS